MPTRPGAAEPSRPTPVRLAETVMERIVAGQYPVGEKLPAEKELARQFGVSRPSVREALRALQFVGYIESVRGSGTRVISRSGAQGAKSRTVTITAAQIVQLFEARLALEPCVAAIAAQDPDLDSLERAEGLVAGMGLVIDEPTLQGDTDLLVHRVIAQVCRNVFLRQSLLDLLDAAGSDQLACVRHEAWSDSELPRVFETQQQQIVRAIRSRDESAAAAASWEHVAASARNALVVVADDPTFDQQAADRLVAVLEGGPRADARSSTAESPTRRPSTARPPKGTTMTLSPERTRALPPRFDFDPTQPDPIPESGIARANELMRSGRLFRYTELAEGEVNDAADLEVRFAELIGRRYAVAVNSCGGSMFVALRACGVGPGDKVLMNGYTLAPVPGAVAHAGAEAVLVEVTDHLTIDLDDLRLKAESSGAKTLLLSHMRGHFADLEAVSRLCDELDITLIEDCAHTLGATWNGRPTGTFGKVGCFSAQTFKHINSGEGGFVVTDDDEVAARAILHSGSYMLYEQHQARPPMSVFEPLKGHIANYSLRMSALEAAVVTPQLDLLPQRVQKMNELYRELERLFREIPRARVVERMPQEEYVGSSFQFSLPDLTLEQIDHVVRTASDYGLHVKWFGEPQMKGFTSRPGQWHYLAAGQELPRTEAILMKLCDIRVPPAMQMPHCQAAADIIRFALDEILQAG